jgi:hypothetical protein
MAIGPAPVVAAMVLEKKDRKGEKVIAWEPLL